MSKVKPHKFASVTPESAADISAIEAYSDRLVEIISSTLFAETGQLLNYEYAEAELCLSSEYAQKIPGFTSVSLFDLPRGKGMIAVRMDERLVSSIVDIIFGGSWTEKADRVTEIFGEVESQLISRLGSNVASQAFNLFFDLDESLEPIGHELSADNVFGEKTEKRMGVLALQIVVDESTCLEFDLLFSEKLVASIGDLDSNSSADISEIDLAWHHQLLENVRQIHLPIRTVLSQPSLPMSRLFQLEPGDVLPAVIRKNPPLYVGNRKFAVGVLGEKDGCAAFKIDHIEKDCS